METITRGYHPWMSLIIKNGDGMFLEWPPEMRDEEDCVKWTLRALGTDFWYARIGRDAIVAARDGTRVHANMERIKKALVTR
jgi:hypothetical protein